MAQKSAATKSATKKSAAKKSPATRTTAKKAPAKKKASATKAAAKKSPAKKSPAKKTTTKRSSAFSAAADRAGGERARRRSTPLISGSEETAAPVRPAARKPAKRASSTPARSNRQGKTVRKAATAARRPELRVVAGEGGTETPAKRARTRSTSAGAAAMRGATTSAEQGQPAATDDGRIPSSGTTVAPGVAELLSVALSAGQMASRSIGSAVSQAAGEDLERRLGEVMAFLRRRVQGDYRVDDFGFDEDFTVHTAFPLLRPLKDHWFRVEVRGIENIPSEGGALLVSNHSGTIAIDSVITQLAIYDEHPQKRFLRMLGADLVFQMPVVGDFARKTGATLATNPDAERLMRNGELVGVWPEGFKGVGKPFRERYKLQRFGRGGFVAAAMRSEVPIIPCSVVGAEEVYPMIGNLKTLARLVGAPYAPVTPTFPLLGPLGLIPLPSKWIIEFSPAVDTASLGPDAADDPALVFDLTDQVRETIQQTLYSVLMTRRSVFF